MTKLDRKGKGIVLMHDFQQATAKALPTIVDELAARGFRVVHMVSKSPTRTIARYDASVTEEAKQKQ